MQGIESLIEVMWWGPWLVLAAASFCFLRAIYDAYAAVVMARVRKSPWNHVTNQRLASALRDAEPPRYGWMAAGWAIAGVVLVIVAIQLVR